MTRLVLKIGGSFLTKKTLSEAFPSTIGEIERQKDLFIELDALESICEEIRKVAENHRVAIVHGAGPFGHALVERIRAGAPIDPRDVHSSMLVLNAVVSLSLSRKGIDATTVSPFDTVEANEGFDTDRLVSLMSRRAEEGVPLSHGDLVPSPSSSSPLGPYKVISGDLVASHLAISWPADKVIMVTDLDGILDRDPALGPGSRIPRVGYEETIALLRGRGRKGADVTGGIMEKVVSCRRPILAGTPLQIISGKLKGDLRAASDGAEVGTIIEPR
jgi:isopentenyl phosphate kinase